MNIVDVLEHFYIERGATRYEIGGHRGVTQLQHALQCAALAADAQAADTLVAAALLHDLGYLLYEAADPELASTRDDVHQYKVLPFLRPYFPPAVLEPIKLHVDAKRYLCAVDPDYRATLSAGSRFSLRTAGWPIQRRASASLRGPAVRRRGRSIAPLGRPGQEPGPRRAAVPGLSRTACTHQRPGHTDRITAKRQPADIGPRLLAGGGRPEAYSRQGTWRQVDERTVVSGKPAAQL